jgi:hypothetical protein
LENLAGILSFNSQKPNFSSSNSIYIFLSIKKLYFH